MYFVKPDGGTVSVGACSELAAHPDPVSVAETPSAMAAIVSLNVLGLSTRSVLHSPYRQCNSPRPRLHGGSSRLDRCMSRYPSNTT